METHQIHPGLLKHKVRVLVVGCGGNGSAIAAGLPYLHQALLAYGHPEGIHVTLLDPEVISATNCVRQPFSQSEIGLHKSVVLANRLNLFWGLDWKGIPERLDPKRRLDGVDIVIGCVDTRKARAAIAKCAEDWSEVDYWLDLGNNADSGQFVLGGSRDCFATERFPTTERLSVCHPLQASKRCGLTPTAGSASARKPGVAKRQSAVQLPRATCSVETDRV